MQPQAWPTPVPTNLASLGQRLVAQILDTVLAAVPIVAALMLGSMSTELGVVAVIAAGGFAVFYLLFADGFSGGQSFGKRIVGISVIHGETGRPCTFGQSFVRNLLLAICGWIDWIFILGGKRQRLGDKAA
ncbi:MAG TPA: RDD family protein, partial [Bryobacteraceae bacterium]|nr:RDD family protein [Bryobacteraceae bacterium]